MNLRDAKRHLLVIMMSAFFLTACPGGQMRVGNFGGGAEESGAALLEEEVQVTPPAPETAAPQPPAATPAREPATVATGARPGGVSVNPEDEAALPTSPAGQANPPLIAAAPVPETASPPSATPSAPAPTASPTPATPSAAQATPPIPLPAPLPTAAATLQPAATLTSPPAALTPEVCEGAAPPIRQGCDLCWKYIPQNADVAISIDSDGLAESLLLAQLQSVQAINQSLSQFVNAVPERICIGVKFSATAGQAAASCPVAAQTEEKGISDALLAAMQQADELIVVAIPSIAQRLAFEPILSQGHDKVLCDYSGQITCQQTMTSSARQAGQANIDRLIAASNLISVQQQADRMFPTDWSPQGKVFFAEKNGVYFAGTPGYLPSAFAVSSSTPCPNHPLRAIMEQFSAANLRMVAAIPLPMFDRFAKNFLVDGFPANQYRHLALSLNIGGSKPKLHLKTFFGPSSTDPVFEFLTMVDLAYFDFTKIRNTLNAPESSSPCVGAPPVPTPPAATAVLDLQVVSLPTTSYLECLVNPAGATTSPNFFISHATSGYDVGATIGIRPGSAAPANAAYEWTISYPVQAGATPSVKTVTYNTGNQATISFGQGSINALPTDPRLQEQLAMGDYVIAVRGVDGRGGEISLGKTVVNASYYSEQAGALMRQYSAASMQGLPKDGVCSLLAKPTSGQQNQNPSLLQSIPQQPQPPAPGGKQ